MKHSSCGQEKSNKRVSQHVDIGVNYCSYGPKYQL